MWSDANDVLTTSYVRKDEHPIKIKLEHARWCMKHESMMGVCVLCNKNQVLIPLLWRYSISLKSCNFFSKKLAKAINIYMRPRQSEVVLETMLQLHTLCTGVCVGRVAHDQRNTPVEVAVVWAMHYDQCMTSSNPLPKLRWSNARGAVQCAGAHK